MRRAFAEPPCYGRAMATTRAWMAWSSGKDAAFALATARARGDVEIVALMTTVAEVHGRVPMHEVRGELLDAQARALDLPLVRVPIPSPCPDAVYERAMAAALERAKRDGVDTVVFGDLFLADLRAYREEKLAAAGMRAEFPLWGRDTRELARSMIASGLRAVVTCVDARKVPPDLAGKEFDEALLAALPPDVDPCGENGELHTFVCFGPGFAQPIAVAVGDVVQRGDYVYADLRARA